MAPPGGVRVYIKNHYSCDDCGAKKKQWCIAHKDGQPRQGLLHRSRLVKYHRDSENFG